MAQSLPLFPLHTVLVPGAALALRVFEPRYLDLVRDCGRNGSGFGVCLILDGREVGAPATPAAFGTEARIEDFDTGPDGLLHLRLRGERRFHALRTRVRDNGLVVADVDWLVTSPPRLATELVLIRPMSVGTWVVDTLPTESLSDAHCLAISRSWSGVTV